MTWAVPEQYDGCSAVTERGHLCRRAVGIDSLGPVNLCALHREQMTGFLRYEANLLREADVYAEVQVAEWRLRLLREEVDTLERRRSRDRMRTADRHMRRHIIDRDDRTCRYCAQEGTSTVGPDGRTWHIDHVVPWSRGGLTVPRNLALACATCNLRKHDRHADDFRKAS